MVPALLASLDIKNETERQSEVYRDVSQNNTQLAGIYRNRELKTYIQDKNLYWGKSSYISKNLYDWQGRMGQAARLWIGKMAFELRHLRYVVAASGAQRHHWTSNNPP